jgi:Sec-independent protein secretion pathway component TatC
MAELVNPFEAPHSRSKRQMTLKGCRLTRLWFALGSMLCYFLLPVGLDWLFSIERNARTIEISSLGGLVFLVSFWSIWLGWLLLLLGSRFLTIVVAAVGLAAIICLPLAVADLAEFVNPGFWAWVVAYGILAVGGLRIPRRTQPKELSEHRGLV